MFCLKACKIRHIKKTKQKTVQAKQKYLRVKYNSQAVGERTVCKSQRVLLLHSINDAVFYGPKILRPAWCPKYNTGENGKERHPCSPNA